MACFSSPTSGESSLDPVSLPTGPADWRENLPDEKHSGTTSLAPRIYEGGGPRSGRGSPPPQRESLLSHGCAVPAPPEGKPRALRTVPAPRIYEGGGPRSGRGSPPPQRESLLSHGCAVPAPPEGKPRALRTVLAPRIYEGGGPRSGRGSPPPSFCRIARCCHKKFFSVQWKRPKS